MLCHKFFVDIQYMSRNAQTRITNLPPNVHRSIFQKLSYKNVRSVGAASRTLHKPAKNIANSRIAAVKRVRGAVRNKLVPLTKDTLASVILVKLRYVMNALHRAPPHGLFAMTQISSLATKMSSPHGIVNVKASLLRRPDDEDPGIDMFVELRFTNTESKYLDAILEADPTSGRYLVMFQYFDSRGRFPLRNTLSAALKTALDAYHRNPILVR